MDNQREYAGKCTAGYPLYRGEPCDECGATGNGDSCGRLNEDLETNTAKTIGNHRPANPPPGYLDMFEDIADFHRKFGIEYTGKPRFLNKALHEFRHKFMGEELHEYNLAALEAREELLYAEPDPGEIITHLEKELDALVDLVYVALGTAHLQGFNFNEAWKRVHAANMKKVRAASAEESKNSTGRGHAADVIKPPGWEPPSHKDLVEDHAHK